MCVCVYMWAHACNDAILIKTHFYLWIYFIFVFTVVEPLWKTLFTVFPSYIYCNAFLCLQNAFEYCLLVLVLLLFFFTFKTKIKRKRTKYVTKREINVSNNKIKSIIQQQQIARWNAFHVIYWKWNSMFEWMDEWLKCEWPELKYR